MGIKKETLDFSFEFASTVGPNTEFILNLEEDQSEDIRRAVDYCQEKELYLDHEFMIDQLYDKLTDHGSLHFSARLLLSSIYVVEEYMGYDFIDEDDLQTYNNLLNYLLLNAQALILTTN